MSKTRECAEQTAKNHSFVFDNEDNDNEDEVNDGKKDSERRRHG